LVVVALAFMMTSYFTDEAFFDEALVDDRFFEALAISSWYLISLL
jgi:hypothetical protein